MKNKFFDMLLMGMVAFSACNDDDDDKGGIPADFNGTYTNSSEEYVLDLKYSEVELLGKSVVFKWDDRDVDPPGRGAGRGGDRVAECGVDFRRQ